LQLAAAIISASVTNDGDRGWTSFVLLIIELNIVVWVGYISDRNAGNAVKELKVRCWLVRLRPMTP
jgi:H+-transporting ATPase